jgi:hypothetical protein
MTLKSIGWIVLGLVVAFGGGWMLGVSGRSAAEDGRRAAVEEAAMDRARTLIQAGRVSLFLANFGDAGTRFEEARAAVERAQSLARQQGDVRRAGDLELAQGELREAQLLAAGLDPAAHRSADAALQALEVAARTSGDR